MAIVIFNKILSLLFILHQLKSIGNLLTLQEQNIEDNALITTLYYIILQVIGVHQETVEGYLTNIITAAVEITAEDQARQEVEEMASKINKVAYEMESS